MNSPKLNFYQFAGVSNTSKLYKRGIRFCTGTGLGAALSTCLQVSFVAPVSCKPTKFPFLQDPNW